MVDPIASQAQIITQQALNSGLSALLKQGPQSGTLAQSTGGKMALLIQGRTFTLDMQGANLKSGDAVLARLVDGKLVLEQQGRSADPTSAASTSASRSLGAVLANLGVSGSNSQILAQAFLQAGIPLDQTALKDLAQFLPQLSSGNVAALSFLFSRGIATSPPIVAMLTHMFSPKPEIAKTTNNVLAKLKSLEKKLDAEPDDEGDAILNASQRRRLREAHGAMQHNMLPMHDQTDPKQEKELEDFLRAALASPEALLLQNPGMDIKTFGEAIIQLLSLLLTLQPLFELSPHAAAFASLFQDVQTLHESLIAQAIHNLPPQSSESAYPVFVQIPYMDNDEERQLELRFTPKDKKKKNGAIDLRLDLSNLGPMHIAIQWDHPHISLNIVVTNPEIQQFIQSALDELKTTLQDNGFDIQSIGVNVGEVARTLKPIHDNQKTINARGLDIRA